MLWPYICRFFEAVGLVAENQFIGEREQNRAIHLLQYLADPIDETSEHHLFLNKILCGWPLGLPIRKFFLINEKEENAISELFEAVIRNWSILEGTSPDGFRASFLKREGVLKRKGRDWVLKVEQKAYDVIMDQLSWPISIIRLPWMDNLIYVEW